MSISEHSVRPKKILMHSPSHGRALEQVGGKDLKDINFFSVPESSAFRAQYDLFVKKISEEVEPIFLADVLSDDPDYALEAASNPNLIFMRDSSITIPWAPAAFIPGRFALESRVKESGIAARALERLGLSACVSFEDDEFIEGGDVLPVEHEGTKALILGFGSRTTEAAARKVALTLIPDYFDIVLGLHHDPDLLHLDTGFTVLPKSTILAATGMFSQGFVIGRSHVVREIDPLCYAEDMGFRIIRVDKQDAILHERCNMLPLGEGKYVAFQMPEEFRQKLEQEAGVSIRTVEGSEIAKAAGGAHCLTRPIFL
jgi:N-dimethylarginine dimethylaminohydrolase